MTTRTISTVLGDATVESDIVYGTGGGHDLLVDVYTPAKRDGLAPGILMIHGGGWSMGARDMHGMVSFGTLLSQMGYVCASITYRLSGEAPWPAQLHDAKAGLRWFRANTDRFGVDPNRIVALGKSAGAHISLMLAATQDDPAHDGDGGNSGVSTKLDAVVTFYPPTKMTRPGIAATDAVKALMGANHNQEALEAISPLTHAEKPGFPPTLLLHGSKDVVVSPGDSTQMYEALRKARVPAELHMYDALPHGFDNENPRMQRQLADIIDMFLARNLTA